jgi:AraC-like DNA-binding protein
MRRNERRRVDWRVTMGESHPPAKLVEPSTQFSELAEFTSALLSEPSAETIDRVLCYAVEFARNAIRLERTAIFLLDAKAQLMVGTWGSDAEAKTVDEHDIMYDYGELDREIFARAEKGFAWTVYDDCPLIAQERGQTRILGRGWVACTAILGARGPIGILFNDTALSHGALDEAKQARAAVLCSLLGRALESSRAQLIQSSSGTNKPMHPVIREVTKLLVRDPTLSCEALAKQVSMSAGQLARTFKKHTQVSIVEHRNELRLARFLNRVDTQASNLLGAALEAGFGSYAQFHRVFRGRFGQTPREYLLEHRQSSDEPGQVAPQDATPH